MRIFRARRNRRRRRDVRSRASERKMIGDVWIFFRWGYCGVGDGYIVVEEI